MPQEQKMSVLLSSTLPADLAKEPWPDCVKLYQPFEVQQIILPEAASCLSVKAFLKMCHLNYLVEMRANAESMSPNGQLPFIRCGSLVIADFEPIVDFARNKSISLSTHLDNTQRADMKAYMSLIKMVLSNAEKFMSWCDKTTFYELTKPRYSCFLPWPINHVLSWQKKWNIRKGLKAVDWHTKTKYDVYDEVNNCCHSLSERLDTQQYFFGDKPTELDALAFGHLYSILSTPLPDNKLSTTVREYSNLVDFCHRIDGQYFQKNSDDEEEMSIEFVT